MFLNYKACFLPSARLQKIFLYYSIFVLTQGCEFSPNKFFSYTWTTQFKWKKKMRGSQADLGSDPRPPSASREASKTTTCLSKWWMSLYFPTKKHNFYPNNEGTHMQWISLEGVPFYQGIPGVPLPTVPALQKATPEEEKNSWTWQTGKTDPAFRSSPSQAQRGMTVLHTR